MIELSMNVDLSRTYRLMREINEHIYRHNFIKHSQKDILVLSVNLIQLYIDRGLKEFGNINIKLEILSGLLGNKKVSEHYARLVAMKLNNANLQKLLKEHEKDLGDKVECDKFIESLSSGVFFDEHIQKIRHFRKYKKIK